MRKEKRKTYIIFLIGFIISSIAFAGTLFMYLNKTTTIKINYDYGDKKEDLSNGLIFSSIDENVNIESVIPTLDKFGVEEKGFSFSIKNTNLNTINYELKLADDDSTIKNSNIRYQLIKNNEIVGIYTLGDDGVVDKSFIESNEEINYTIKLWLDYNSEVQLGTLRKKIVINEIIGDDEIFVNEPIMTNGLIPVSYNNSTNSWQKADIENINNSWYSYEDNKWANAVTIDANKRKYYEESEVGTKIEIEDINSMWVWIPRFNYSIGQADININFVKTVDPAYLAFTFNDNELDGFWFSKFESGMKSDSECITSSLTKICNSSNNKLYFVPNYPFATKMTMANMFYAIRKMELKNNIYGFSGTGNKVNNDGTIKNDKNNIDIHMIRNSEWQAVALLSNSVYGNKTWQVINNNSNVTGKAFYEETEFDYNAINKGTKASTNGNITGIYDMSGGKREFVMIDNSEQSIFSKKSNSGFSGKVKECYYDDKFIDDDTTLTLKNKYSLENLINSEPITRGGYKNTGNIFNIYGTTDYIDKVSVETNSRACLTILKEKDNEEKKES